MPFRHFLDRFRFFHKSSAWRPPASAGGGNAASLVVVSHVVLSRVDGKEPADGAGRGTTAWFFYPLRADPPLPEERVARIPSL
jgi:hypothetical protein